ncbi:MAG: 5'-nucleotidase C-terminal domain-containing protein [Bacillota bacterium]
MITNSRKSQLKILSIALVLAFVAVGIFTGPVSAQDDEYTLTIMGTSDLHQYLVPYDYMNDEPFDNYGFSKTYTLIEEVRANSEYSILLDAGDNIQGSMIGNYEALVDPIKFGESQTIIEAMNFADYDLAAVGNHEIQDFGLEFFDIALNASEFPWIAANMYHADSGDYYTQPFEVLYKRIDGELLSIGVIGFAPPEIMQWGRSYVKGEVEFEDIVESARKHIPMLEKFTDILIVNSHTGIGTGSGSYDDGYELVQMDGVDAYLGGHSHSKFPSEDYADLEGVNLEEGTIFGTPTAKAGRWGSTLSVIDLNLTKDNGEWEITGHDVRVLEVTEDTESHPEIERIAQDIHEKTVDYIRTPIGSTERPVAGYFSEVMDSTVTQVVNNAQMWFAENQLAGSEYEDLPIVSVAAPFQTSTYVEDDVTIGDITDIYLYDNTIFILEFTGQELIDFLERSAEHFGQIDPDTSEAQTIDILGPSYNYDVIEGIEYEIDITQPEGERIENVTYQGEPIDLDQEFALITNDYRAGGGGEFPHTGDDAEVIFSSDNANRDQIIYYIEEYGSIDPRPTNNWKLQPVDTEGPVYFETNADAVEYLEANNQIQGIEFVEYTEDDNALFELDLENLGWD